jgi:ubiquinone/menaquinone biosynthesis C-methylase UbiE
MKRPEYQFGYAKKFSQYMYDESSRRNKAMRTVVLAKDFFSDDLKKYNCLEMGSSTGIMCYFLADFFNRVIGIDIDREALDFAKKKYLKPNIEYWEMDAQATKFPDKSFDFIVCHHTYEHVNDSRKLTAEIYRLLKDGGVCYFGAPNRLMPVESHYNIPFLSLLPYSAASWVLRIFNKDEYYYERMLSWWGLKKLLKNFTVHDYTLKIFCEPQKYYSTDLTEEYRFIKLLPKSILRLLRPWYPDYVFMITKKSLSK